MPLYTGSAKIGNKGGCWTTVNTVDHPCVHGRMAKTNPLLSNKNISACLQFPNHDVDKPTTEKTFWGQMRKQNYFCLNERLISEGGGNVVVWVAVSGPGWFVIVDGPMNSEIY